MNEELPKSISIQLFGQMALTVDGVNIRLGSGSNNKLLLAYLALCYDRDPISRPKAGQLFWPGKEQKSTDGSLRTCLSRVRMLVRTVKLLDPFLESQQDKRVSIDLNVVDIDLRSFDLAFSDGRFDQAEELYRGSLLDGLENEAKEADVLANILPTIEERRKASKDKYLMVLRQLINEAVQHRDSLAVIKYGDKAIATAPTIASQYHQKMEALYQLGELKVALNTFDLMQARGIEASAETASLAGRIRTAVAAKPIAETINVELFSAEQDQVGKDPNPGSPSGHQKIQTAETDAPNIRKAILRDIRFTELPLFGEGAATYNLFQSLTVARESSTIVFQGNPSSAQLRLELNQSDHTDEAGVSLRKDASKTVPTLVHDLKKTKSVWRLPLLAPPGAGKTTLLRWLALQAAEQADFLECSGKSLIPAYVPLHDLQDGVQNDIADHLAAQHTTGPNAEVWRQWLANGDCLLLLDGVELVSHAQRIRALLHEYALCPAILTCRTVMRERLEAALTGIKHEPIYLLEPLSEEHQEHYLNSYPGLSKEHCDSLQYILQERNDLRLLCANPLLLSLLCYVAKRNKMPLDNFISRSSLYHTAVLTVLRERPQEEKRLALYQDNPIHGDEMRDALAHATLHVVHEMLTDLCHLDQQSASISQRKSVLKKASNGYFARETFVRGLEDWQKTTGRAGDIRGSVLSDICVNSRLISGDATGVFSDDILFTHRTFQEYLVAVGLADIARLAAQAATKGLTGKLSANVVANAGWNAIRPFVEALAWLPGFEETIVFLAGILLERRQDAIATRMLRLLSDAKTDDSFRHRLALAAMSVNELTGKPMTPQLSSCLRDISQQVILTAKQVISRAYAGRSLSPESEFPVWMKSHPVGRALGAIGSAYRTGHDGRQVGIFLGEQFSDPAKLNEDILKDDSENEPTAGFLGEAFTHDSDRLHRLIKESWMLTLLGPAMALPPVRDKLLARAGNFHWRCIAHPIGAALRHSSAKTAREWSAWIYQMIEAYKGAMIMEIVPVFPQTATSLRYRCIEDVLSYIEKTPPDVEKIPTDAPRKNVRAKEYLQDYATFALSPLLQGNIPEPLRHKAQSVLRNVPTGSRGMCLLNLGFSEVSQETTHEWKYQARNLYSGDTQKYTMAWRLWAGEVSVEEAYPHITGTFGTIVFDVPAFVTALTDGQRQGILSLLLKEAVATNADNLSYEDKIGIIARAGNIGVQRWLRAELLNYLDGDHSERTTDFLWRTLLQLAEEAIGATELQDHACEVAVTGFWGFRQRLISMAGKLADEDESARLEIERYVNGNFPIEFRKIYKERKIAYLTGQIDALREKNEGAGGTESGFDHAAETYFVRQKVILENRPVGQLRLPGGGSVQYAAAVALSSGGVDYFSEDIRRLIQQSYKNGGASVERAYPTNQPPWFEWVQAGLRIFPKAHGRTQAFLTMELATQSFRKRSLRF